MSLWATIEALRITVFNFSIFPCSRKFLYIVTILTLVLSLQIRSSAASATST